MSGISRYQILPGVMLHCRRRLATELVKVKYDSAGRILQLVWIRQWIKNPCFRSGVQNDSLALSCISRGEVIAI